MSRSDFVGAARRNSEDNVCRYPTSGVLRRPDPDCRSSVCSFLSFPKPFAAHMSSTAIPTLSFVPFDIARKQQHTHIPGTPEARVLCEEYTRLIATAANSLPASDVVVSGEARLGSDEKPGESARALCQ